MKTKYAVLISVLGFLGISAVKLGRGYSIQDWEWRLKMRNSSILANITESPNGEIDADDGYFKLPYAKLLPSVISGDKIGAAKELCDYIKVYCNSQEFSKEYSSRRERSRPSSEPTPMDAETLKMTRESIQDMEAELVRSKKIKKGPRRE